MTYLQFFSDYAPYLDPFDDAERGRLLTAMLAYAFDGTETEFAGNERFIWPVFRKMIDQSRAALEKKQAASARGLASRWGKGESPDAVPCLAVAADCSECQEIAGDTTEYQRIADDGSECQAEANDGNKQESRYKNQDSKVKNQTPKDKKQGSEPKAGDIHTHPGTATSRPRARVGPPDPGGFCKPWFDPEDPDADCDDAWRTSAKARAAVAQRIIDYLGDGFKRNPDAGEPYQDLLGLMCRLMQRGMHPSVISETVKFSPNWRKYVCNLLLVAARESDWRSGPYPEEYGRFLSPDTMRKYGILPPKEGGNP